MRHLRDDTVLILDGEVRVYRRERSRRWQAAFSIDGKAIRISTGKKDLNEAKEIARDTYLEYKFRHKNDLPVITKKFSDVARLAITDMRKQLDAGLGKKVYADYIVCIERYLVPYFGSQYVTSIDYEKVQSFYEWRRAKMGREPKASTLNTHNSAMNRVFDEAVARGFLAHKNDLPVITKKFSDVARLAIADMRKQLDAGLGKKVYADYIVCIERYLIHVSYTHLTLPTILLV